MTVQTAASRITTANSLQGVYDALDEVPVPGGIPPRLATTTTQQGQAPAPDDDLRVSIAQVAVLAADAHKRIDEMDFSLVAFFISLFVTFLIGTGLGLVFNLVIAGVCAGSLLGGAIGVGTGIGFGRRRSQQPRPKRSRLRRRQPQAPQNS